MSHHQAFDIRTDPSLVFFLCTIGIPIVYIIGVVLCSSFIVYFSSTLHCLPF